MSRKLSQDNCDPAKVNFIRKFRDDNSSYLKKLTASQFVEIWEHYDKNFDGYIEGHELDKFLCDLATSTSKGNKENAISDVALQKLKETFMTAFDEDSNGKITVSEMAEILPVDENFIFLFHREVPLESSVEFMKIWRQFDKNSSGFIEMNELRDLVEYLLSTKSEKGIEEETITEYANAIMELFDTNRDGRLQFSEMSRLLPVKKNILLKPIIRTFNSVGKDDLDNVFRYYDENNSQFIEGPEIDALVKDLIELVRSEYDEDDFNEFKRAIMEGCDVNHDEKLKISELKMILMSLQDHSRSYVSEQSMEDQ